MEPATQPSGGPTASHPSLLAAVRRHLVVVCLFLVAGAALGWYVGPGRPATYTSTAKVLINPTVGNPFAPSPSSVRQDELTSLETESQVAGSTEVLREVVADIPAVTLREAQQRGEVAVPPNSQVLELTYTAEDPSLAEEVADAWARAYLANRDRRFRAVNDERIARVATRTDEVVEDLRSATAAAQAGSPAERAFQAQLADALRNELVSLRAQRGYLENTESAAGSMISPASRPVPADTLVPPALFALGSLAGLALGLLAAWLLSRFAVRIRSASDVQATGLRVLTTLPARRRRLSRRRSSEEPVEAAMRRLRAAVLTEDPVPDIISVAPVGDRVPATAVAEALAESLGKAGHRVVLVRAHSSTMAPGLEAEKPGLSDALLHGRLSVLDMLQPSVDPLLSLLPWGLTQDSRELLEASRLRDILEPLVSAGHIVVLQSPDLDSVEGEAVVGAADLGLVVVRTRETRVRQLEEVAARLDRSGAALAAVVVDAHSSVPATAGPSTAGRTAPSVPAKPQEPAARRQR